MGDGDGVGAGAVVPLAVGLPAPGVDVGVVLPDDGVADGDVLADVEGCDFGVAVAETDPVEPWPVDGAGDEAPPPEQLARVEDNIANEISESLSRDACITQTSSALIVRD